jgi:predicted nucleotidyltransferase
MALFKLKQAGVYFDQFEEMPGSMKHLIAKPMPDGTRQDILQRVRAAVLGRFNPIRVIVFGSLARGDGSDFSDVDLLVIVSEKGDVAPCRSALAGLGAQLNVPVDVLVYDEATFKERLNVGGVCQIAADEGLMLWPDGGAHVA